VPYGSDIIATPFEDVDFSIISIFSLGNSMVEVHVLLEWTDDRGAHTASNVLQVADTATLQSIYEIAYSAVLRS